MIRALIEWWLRLMYRSGMSEWDGPNFGKQKDGPGSESHPDVEYEDGYEPKDDRYRGERAHSKPGPAQP